MRNEIESLQEEEQEYIDNMPENLQGSERSERSEECVSSMESAGSSISEVIDCLQEAIEN